VLFNEPKLLKFYSQGVNNAKSVGFSALQRAEIAEIVGMMLLVNMRRRFSALQRAEIAEIVSFEYVLPSPAAFQCSSTSRNC